MGSMSLQLNWGGHVTGGCDTTWLLKVSHKTSFLLILLGQTPLSPPTPSYKEAQPLHGQTHKEMHRVSWAPSQQHSSCQSCEWPILEIDTKASSPNVPLNNTWSRSKPSTLNSSQVEIHEQTEWLLLLYVSKLCTDISTEHRWPEEWPSYSTQTHTHTTHTYTRDWWINEEIYQIKYTSWVRFGIEESTISKYFN